MITNNYGQPEGLSPQELKKTMTNLVKHVVEMFEPGKKNRSDETMSIKFSHKLCKLIKDDLIVVKNIDFEDYIPNEQLFKAAKAALDIFITHRLFEFGSSQIAEEKTKEIKNQLLEAIDSTALLPIMFYNEKTRSTTSEKEALLMALAFLVQGQNSSYSKEDVIDAIRDILK